MAGHIIPTILIILIIITIFTILPVLIARIYCEWQDTAKLSSFFEAAKETSAEEEKFEPVAAERYTFHIRKSLFTGEHLHEHPRSLAAWPHSPSPLTHALSLPLPPPRS